MRLATAALLLTAAAARAEEACGADPDVWLDANLAALEGFWAAENTAMIMVAPAVGTRDMGAQGPLTLSLTATDGGLMAEPGEVGAMPVLLRPTARELVIEPPEALENQLDGDEIGVLLDCEPADLPVLHGRGEATIEGTAVSMELTALVAGTDLLLMWAHFASPIGDVYLSYLAER
ncbi:MAG: hypothetical protein ACU0BS_01940 [Hasllibacter sp.]